MSIGDFGARVLADGNTQFRLWAPDAHSVDVSITGGDVVAMQRDEHGVYRAVLPVSAGTAYRYRVNGKTMVPDPASRRQSRDVHDDSVVVDTTYAWQHGDWTGRPWHEAVLYEVHAGSFGGFKGVQAQLPRLAALGITAIELMPVADFPGRHNWGYDGVLLYAPETSYGTPADLQAMIDAAHGLGMMVFLDVVYNHFGPDGNYLNEYAASFFRADQHTLWGNAIDFRKRQVRRFFIENALYWLRDIRFDGLRFDAVQAIGDKDFLHELAAEVRAGVAGRQVHLVLENERNDAGLLRTAGGAAAEADRYDAQWTDDWHHSIHILLTGETEGYYGDFPDPVHKLARCMAEGFAYQGEIPPITGEGTGRGTSSAHLPPTDFVICLQNHDQIGNRAMGERIHSLTAPNALRAATVLLLLMPQIPLLFMGQEWGATTPFLYFTDHHEDLGEAIRVGRRKEFSQFAGFANEKTRNRIPDPNARATFEATILTPPTEPDARTQDWMDLFADCLRLRHEHIIPYLPGCTAIGATVIGAAAVRGVWRLNDGAVLTLAANFASTEVPCAAGDGKELFATLPDVCMDGVLAGFSACAWLHR